MEKKAMTVRDLEEWIKTIPDDLKDRAVVISGPYGSDGNLLGSVSAEDSDKYFGGSPALMTDCE